MGNCCTHKSTLSNGAHNGRARNYAAQTSVHSAGPQYVNGTEPGQKVGVSLAKSGGGGGVSGGGGAYDRQASSNNLQHISEREPEGNSNKDGGFNAGIEFTVSLNASGPLGPPERRRDTR